MKMINLSNHSSEKWTDAQRAAALELCPGGIVDMGFPQIDPEADADEIKRLAKYYVSSIIENHGRDVIVHVMGEAGFVHAFVTQAMRDWNTDNPVINCVHSTTRRTIVEEGDGVKTSKFEFVRFRFYAF